MLSLLEREVGTLIASWQAVEPIAEEEVKEAIMSLKKKKAPGPDGIHAEVWQVLKKSLTQLLCSFYNECLVHHTKRGRQRPYSTTIIQADLPAQRITEQQKGLHPNQYGFRKGRSAEDAVNRALDVVHASNAKCILRIFIACGFLFWYIKIKEFWCC